MTVTTYHKLTFVDGYIDANTPRLLVDLRSSLRRSHAARCSQERRRMRENAKLSRSDEEDFRTPSDTVSSGSHSSPVVKGEPSNPPKHAPTPALNTRILHPFDTSAIDGIPNASTLFRSYAVSKIASPAVKDAIYTALLDEVCLLGFLAYMSAVTLSLRPGVISRQQSLQLNSASMSALRRSLQSERYNPSLALRAIVFMTVVAIRHGDLSASRTHLRAVQHFAKTQAEDPDMTTWLATAQSVNAQYAMACFEPVLIPPLSDAKDMILLDDHVDPQQRRLVKRIENQLVAQRRRLFLLIFDCTRLLLSISRSGSDRYVSLASHKLYLVMYELSHLNIGAQLSSNSPDSCRLDVVLLMETLMCDYSLTNVAQVESVLIGRNQTKYIMWQHPAIPTTTTPSSAQGLSSPGDASECSGVLQALATWNTIIGDIQPTSQHFSTSALIMQLMEPLRIAAGDVYKDIANFMQTFLEKQAALLGPTRTDIHSGRRITVNILNNRGQTIGFCTSRLV